MGVNVGFRTKKSAMRFARRTGGRYIYEPRWKERRTLKSKWVRKPYVVRI